MKQKSILLLWGICLFCAFCSEEVREEYHTHETVVPYEGTFVTDSVAMAQLPSVDRREIFRLDESSAAITDRSRYSFRMNELLQVRSSDSGDSIRITSYSARTLHQVIYLAGSRIKNSDGIPELQILICFNRPEDGVATYKKRWEIETAFRAMKSSGFNIEDTHLRDRVRIARLFAMVCMALVWAYLVGEHKDIYVKPIKILKHGRRAKSLVKYGLEEISNVLFRPTYTPKFDVFKFLSCT